MVEKLWFLIPEMILFGAAVVVSIMGLAKSRSIRELTPMVTAIGLAIAGIVTPFLYTPVRLAEADFFMPYLGKYVKMVVCVIGILLVMVNTGLIDRRLEAAIASRKAAFDPIRVTRGEFFAFFLLSLMGVMLCCNANDLIWLFLSLELTSLPTYVMVAMSRSSKKAQEAAIKYFFLGALAAAIFLYGFALLYGATGTIVLSEMKQAFAEQLAQVTIDANGLRVRGSISMLGIAGMLLAILGVSFKIAAAPLHFYAADVYEGAASAVTAFLAFVPKFAGFIAIITLLSTMGWIGHRGVDPNTGAEIAGLPAPVTTLLWVVAVLTMTLGNVAALLQKSVKRILAYSSIAHSGYILIGVIAGPGDGIGANGIGAALFYILTYGVMNTAAFAVLAGLERQGHEIESLNDLAGLNKRHRWMAAVMAVSAFSLVGLPFLLGFWGKLGLFMEGISAGHLPLVVIAGLNSAISSWYYLGLVKQVLLERPSAQAETIRPLPSVWPRVAGIVTAAATIVLPLFALQPLITASTDATRMEIETDATAEVAPVADDAEQELVLNTERD